MGGLASTVISTVRRAGLCNGGGGMLLWLSLLHLEQRLLPHSISNPLSHPLGSAVAHPVQTHFAPGASLGLHTGVSSRTQRSSETPRCKLRGLPTIIFYQRLSSSLPFWACQPSNFSHRQRFLQVSHFVVSCNTA